MKLAYSFETLAGRSAVVFGAAPLSRAEQLLTVHADDYIIAVNGGISSWPLIDAWVLNSRNIASSSWSPPMRQHSTLMLEQGKSRHVPLALLMTKHDGAGDWTREFLRKQGTEVLEAVEIHNEARRALETLAGARTADMQKYALSLGLFAVAWAFLRNARTVRMVGFSWEAGYAYQPGKRVNARGHIAGDREALRRLEARYGERLIHSLAPEAEDMTKKKAATPPPRPSAARATSARASRQTAKAATTPAAERAKKVEKAVEQQAAAARPARVAPRMVRATERTYYNLRRRKAGEVFQLRQESDFRPSCMEWANPGERETPRPTVAEASRTRRMAANAADVLDDAPVARTGKVTDDNPLGIDQ